MKLIVFTISTIILCANLKAQDLWTSGRPDGHSPIVVMGDHTHNKGEIMFSYRYMFMDMVGMRNNGNSQTADEVLQNYLITPLKMPMNMHMLGLMYAVSDQLTIMTMFNYVSQSMGHRTRMGSEFTTSSRGLGDAWISGLYKIHDQNRKRLHINLGIKIPTGSIDATDITPASAPNETQLPYPMQLGSGTVNIKPGLTYLIQNDKSSFGIQGSLDLPINENERDYKWGTKTELVGWGAYKINDYLSLSFSADAVFQGKIKGSDESFAMAVANSMVPTADSQNFGGTWVYAGGGVNFYIPDGAIKNVRIGLEYKYPVVQNINGPQMELKQKVTLGVQYSL